MFKSKITFAVIIPAYENNKFLYMPYQNINEYLS